MIRSLLFDLECRCECSRPISIDLDRGNMGDGENGDAPALKPAVSPPSSVKESYIVCLDYGQKMKMLKRHLSTEHNLSPRDKQ